MRAASVARLALLLGRHRGGQGGERQGALAQLLDGDLQHEGGVHPAGEGDERRAHAPRMRRAHAPPAWGGSLAERPRGSHGLRCSIPSRPCSGARTATALACAPLALRHPASRGAGLDRARPGASLGGRWRQRLRRLPLAAAAACALLGQRLRLHLLAGDDLQLLGRHVAEVQQRLEDLQARRSSTLSVSEWIVTSGEVGGSYGSVMPMKLGISPLSAFLYCPWCRAR